MKHWNYTLLLADPRCGKSMMKKFAKKTPGDQIFHDLWMPHSMKTDGQPVLALFSWSGAIFKEAVPIN